jgi:SAM-dependent methyltransferase
VARDRVPAGRVVQGDATKMPFADATFSAVACLTMLHHLPVSELQDRLFVEVHRVLGPGGVFCGSDNPGRGFNFASSTSATTRLSSIQTPSGGGCTPWRSSTPRSAPDRGSCSTLADPTSELDLADACPDRLAARPCPSWPDVRPGRATAVGAAVGAVHSRPAVAQM